MRLSPRQAFSLIAAYALLAAAWGWRLHADDPAPSGVNPLLADTRTAIASSLARAPAHLQQPAVLQLALLPDHQVEALHAWLKAAPEQRLRQLTVREGPLNTPSPLNTALVFVELTRADAPLIEDSRLLLSASGDRISEPHKIEALELLASQAAAAGERTLAIEIHERVCAFPSATWQHALALIEAARAARRPAAALRVVKDWLSETPSRLDAAQREAALDLQISLLLEGSRYAEASRVTLESLRALKAGAAIPARLMQRALLATRAAGESAELMPWIERQLRASPDHQLSLKDLAAKPSVDAGYRHWLAEGACIADLNHQSSIACEFFFRLAALGETHVLARLHALVAQLGRGRELAAVLASLQHRFPPHQLAQALAEGDAPAAARAFLTAHLQSSADDREGWRMLAQIDMALRGEAASTMLWQGFLKRFPGDVTAMRQLAACQVSAAQPRQALDTLQSIPVGQLDEPTLRHIAALAVQLDDVPAAHRAQQLLVASSAHPSARDVLALATTTLQHPDAAAAHEALSEAASRLPAGTGFHRFLTAIPGTVEATHFSTAAKSE
ncbi:tetratricopeptide repeat protein [Prosthecobacter fluviatilis]|uniref:Tetratricopeptide repeat protein n=1 Tax=Prosthecobacter fluviatilis TaxID=445931 RepID=A0ABW0KSW9_9BACT